MKTLTPFERIKPAIVISVLLYALGIVSILLSILLLAIAALQIFQMISKLGYPGLIPVFRDPTFFYAGLILAIIGILLRIVNAFQVYIETRRAITQGLSLQTIDRPLTFFAVSYFLMELAGVVWLQFSQIFLILAGVGVLLLWFGFRLYFSKRAEIAPETPLIGAILLILGLTLVYVVSPFMLNSLFLQLYGLPPSFIKLPGGKVLSDIPQLGPLGSEYRFEAVALFILAIVGLIAVFLPENMTPRLVEWTTPLASLIFSIGMMYAGFISTSIFGSLLSGLGSPSIPTGLPGEISTLINLIMASFTFILAGSILLGIAGLVATTVLAIQIALRLSALHQKMPTAFPSQPPPPPPPPPS
ncbi:MAG: hypothetical protein JHC26_01155 [Thermofilum sp.]|jgi:hypothetical protein|uniref:hypothetical protein n=1 Tax=Thermofilum sp. TaxID=1961369 RepID=UPI00258B1DDE|nr:hypothetical protein [Thermofilum sp.]MCI4407667.1 hypothetical protein [Thermofilum sp.]